MSGTYHLPYEFTDEQMEIALAVYDNLNPKKQAAWAETRNRTKEEDR